MHARYSRGQFWFLCAAKGRKVEGEGEREREREKERAETCTFAQRLSDCWRDRIFEALYI